MNKRSTLNDALIFSGGLKTTKGPIVFIRYDNNGKMDRRTFRYSKSAKSGSYKNPYLNNGDLIVVTSGILSQTNDIIQEITNPLTGIKKSYEAIKLFTD